jgi:hypothetical protein
MKLDDITNKVRDNFEKHLNHAKQSKFFQDFSDKFFIGIDMQDRNLKSSSVITRLKERVEDNIYKVLGGKDEIQVDPESLKALQKIMDNNETINSQSRPNPKFKM